MKVAYCKSKIKIQLPIHLDGYFNRVSNKIHDNPEIVSLALQDDQGQILIAHVLDVVMIENELAEKLIKKIEQKFAIPTNQILIAATHTHSSVKIARFLFPKIVPPVELMQNIEAEILQNTEFCLNHLQAAEPYYHEAAITGLYSNRDDAAGPFNNHVYGLQFRDPAGKPICELVNIACHPTTVDRDGLEVSRDMVGYLRDAYEAKTGIPLAVFNGEAGDVSTRFTRKGHGYAEAEKVGTGIAQALLGQQHYQKLDGRQMQVKAVDFHYQYQPSQDADLSKFDLYYKNMLNKTNDPELIDGIKDMDRIVQEKLNQQQIELDLKSRIISFSDWQIVQFPGELFTKFGQEIRNANAKKTIIFGYADGYNGYAVPEAEYADVAESRVSNFPRGSAEKFIEKIIQGMNA